MTCVNCGAALAGSGRFCTACGAPQPAAGAPPGRKPTQRWRWAVLGLAAALVGGSLAAGTALVLQPSGDDGGDAAPAATAPPAGATPVAPEPTDVSAADAETPAASDPPTQATGVPQPATEAPPTTPTEPATTPPPTRMPVIAVLSPELIQVFATSQLEDTDTITYGPGNVFDGELETAWNHCGTGCTGTGPARQGVGEALSFLFDGPVELSGFRIANGYQKIGPSGDVWGKNNRIRTLSVSTAAGRETVTLDDAKGHQEVTIEPAVTTS